MVWLLTGSLLFLGLVVLVVATVVLSDRLRSNKAAVKDLRATLDGASDRLRAGQALVREWRAARRGGGSSGPDA